LRAIPAASSAATTSSMRLGDARFVTPRSVDVYVRRIREKIEIDPENPRYLKTVRAPVIASNFRRASKESSWLLARDCRIERLRLNGWPRKARTSSKLAARSCFS